MRVKLNVVTTIMQVLQIDQLGDGLGKIALILPNWESEAHSQKLETIW